MKKSNSLKRNLLLLCGVVLVIAYIWQEFSVENTTEDEAKDLTEIETDLTGVNFKLPSPFEGHQIINHGYFTLSYNETHEQADWVAYTLYPFADTLSVKRRNSFRRDDRVLTGSATLADYRKSGYDRGHLAPSKAFSYSKEAMKSTYFMSNMSPQLPKFNQGIWRLLEAEIYKWSKRSDSMYIVTGPVLRRPLGTIGNNKVSIPNSYYKTVIRFKNKEMTAIGFLLPNQASRRSYFEFATSIDSIENVTGINFYANLPETLEIQLERNSDVFLVFPR